MTEICYICRSKLIEHAPEIPIDGEFFSCPRCGEYNLSGSVLAAIRSGKFQLLDDDEKIAKASYKIRSFNRKGAITPYITSYDFELFLKEELPSLNEQLDNLIRFIAENSKYGEAIFIHPEMDTSVIGSLNQDSIRLLMNTIEHFGYLEQMSFDFTGWYKVSLSFQGWQYFMELESGDQVSNKAFIAMKFGNEELDHLVNDYLREAVRQTGFRLERADDNKEAGLIDAKMRVQIRTSRFLIVDLTHDNYGAYWEAGFAEGLGKPVIYICNKTKFEEEQTHFDTNHQHTVLWDLESPQEFVEELKNTIRATLPEHAILEDK